MNKNTYPFWARWMIAMVMLIATYTADKMALLPDSTVLGCYLLTIVLQLLNIYKYSRSRPRPVDTMFNGNWYHASPAIVVDGAITCTGCSLVSYCATSAGDRGCRPNERADGRPIIWVAE